MEQTKVPHLCGGTFFALVLQAKKNIGTARDKLSGGNKILSATDVFAGLTKVLTGDTISTKGGTLTKCASLYKTCQAISGGYVPFKDTATASSFDSSIKAKNPAIYERMTEFINTYLNQDKCEWLVRALIDTIQHDTCIPGTTLFSIDYDQTITKGRLDKIKGVVLQAFLVSVLHYVVMNAPDSESGRSTFERWFSQSSKRAEWKYCGKAGGSIHRINVELIDYDPGGGKKDVDEDGSEKQEGSDADGLTGVPLVVHQVAPDLSNLLNSKVYMVDDELFEDRADETKEQRSTLETSETDTYVLSASEKYKWMRLPGEGDCLIDDYYVCSNLGTSSAVYPLKIKGKVIEEATLEKIKSFDKRAEILCAIIIGACGFGKTLMLQHLFLEAVKSRIKTGMLPIFAELRNFSETYKELLPFLVDTIQEYDQKFSEGVLVDYLSKGRVQILLDGLDEMDPKETIHFQRELAKLRQRYPNNQVVISSRQCGAISGIRNYVPFYLHPLSEEQADKLIDKLLVGNEDETAKETIKLFTKPDTGYVINNGFIATNPMLLTIMVREYEEIKDFRGSRAKFYGKLYNALIRGHDAEKQAYGRFFHSVSDGNEFTQLFREFCALSYVDGVYEFDARSFEKYFRKLQGRKELINPAKCQLRAFQQDVCATACMMYEQESGIYYIDIGFQDYFFAEFFYYQDDTEKNKAMGRAIWNGKINPFQKLDALIMAYEIADEKTVVYVFLPYLDNIFKGKTDDEAFFRFLFYGYGNIRYILQDRPQIYKFVKGRAEQYVSLTRFNYAKSVMRLLCAILDLSNEFEISFMAEKVQPDEFTTHFIAGYYDDGRFQNEDDDVRHTLLFAKLFEIEHMGDNEYIQNQEFTPFPVSDKKTGKTAVFGYLYSINPLLFLDIPERQKEFLTVCKDRPVWKIYESVKAYYRAIVDKQRINDYR